MTGRNKTYKTPAYKQYQEDIRDELRGTPWPLSTHPCSFFIEVGFSNRAADLDNVIKPLLDTFQVIYEEFNDNKVYYIELNKNIVKKGEEYIRVKVGLYNNKIVQGHKQKVSEEVYIHEGSKDLT